MAALLQLAPYDDILTRVIMLIYLYLNLDSITQDVRCIYIYLTGLYSVRAKQSWKLFSPFFVTGNSLLVSTIRVTHDTKPSQGENTYLDFYL